MRETLNAALKDAIKTQDKRRMSTLRLISATIKDRDIAARSHGKDGVDDNEILQILGQLIKQRRQSIEAYENGGRPELAQQEAEEIVIIESFLPKQMSEDEIRVAVDTVMSELDCGGLKDMGRTMSCLKERYTGQMDFAKASAMVKERLQ